MKRTITLLSFLLLVFLAFGQVPGAFNYQAVVRNSSGEVLANANVTFRISILLNSSSGTSAYVETQAATTNGFGLVNLKIGKGTKVSGNFTPDSWGTASHFMKVEVDPAGGSSYSQLGTTELLSVPYAFHAKTVENNNDADADATNEIQTLSLSGTQLSLSKNGGTVTLPSSGGTVGDNWGTQTVVSDATLDGAGTTASPLSVVGDLTDNQTLSISGNDLSITGGNTVTLPAGSVSPWTVSGNNIYRNLGFVGIGTSTPFYNLALGGQGAELSFQDAASGAASGITWRESGNDLKASLTYYGPNVSFKLSNQAVGGDVFISAKDKIELQTNGSTKLTVLDDGNVGIGVSDPYYQLEIEDDYLSVINLIANNPGNGTSNRFHIGMYTSSKSASLANLDYGPMTFSTDNAIRMIIDEDGHVGIGTDPSGSARKFQVITTNELAIAAENNTTSYPTLHLTNKSGGPAMWIGTGKFVYKDGTEGTNKILTSDPSGYASWESPLWNKNSTSIYYTVGKVGIGTQTPSAGFHLKGTGFPSSFMYIESSSGQDAGIRLYEGTTAQWHIFNNSGAGGLQIYNSGAKTAIFAKQSNSFVGIGTTSPTQALHVVGNAYKTEGGTSWATSSDIRLKNISGNYDKGLNEIMKLVPVRYIYKKDNPRQLNSETEQVGFVAQEVQKVFPEAVSVGEDGYLDFNIHPINIAFVNAIKELKNENDALKSQVDKLENRLEQLEALMEASAKK